MLHDYRKPYKRRRFAPLDQFLITPLAEAREERKSIRATCLGLARRSGKPVRLWIFQIHNDRCQPCKFLEYFETAVTNDNDEISAMIGRGRQLGTKKITGGTR